MTRFFDTSALLNGAHEILKASSPFLLSITTLRELEDIKASGKKDEEVKYKARQVLVYLYTNPADYVVVDGTLSTQALSAKNLPLTNDNHIMMDAVLYETSNSTRVMFYTSDLSCHLLALNQFKLASKLFTPNIAPANYDGYLQVSVSDDELAEFYMEQPGQESPKTQNKFNLLRNQYLVLENSHGTVVDMYRWSGTEYIPLKYDTLRTPHMGIIMPANIEQKLAFDLLQNDDITIKILAGRYGSGKTLLMLSHALHLLRTEQINKIIYMRNGVKMKNVADIGMLPGDSQAKLLPGAMPLVDHLGSLDVFYDLVDSEKIELVDLGMVRGRSWSNAIILCGEAENLTKQHIQLLIGRVGKDSQLWIDGDFKQVDSKIFESNNGMMTAIDRLKGRELFGYVKLQKTERSDTASLADLLD